MRSEKHIYSDTGEGDPTIKVNRTSSAIHVRQDGQIDDITEAVISVDFEHHELHEGDMFSVWVTSTEGDGDAIEVAIKPPNNTKRFHAIAEHFGSNAHSFQIIENVTSLAAGTAGTAVNRNRNSSNTTAALTLKTGTDSGTALTYTGGTNIWTHHMPSGRNATAGRATTEWILKNNVDTVFRLQAEAAATELWLAVIWYEHTDSN